VGALTDGDVVGDHPGNGGGGSGAADHPGNGGGGKVCFHSGAGGGGRGEAAPGGPDAGPSGGGVAATEEVRATRSPESSTFGCLARASRNHKTNKATTKSTASEVSTTVEVLDWCEADREPSELFCGATTEVPGAVATVEGAVDGGGGGTVVVVVVVGVGLARFGTLIAATAAFVVGLAGLAPGPTDPERSAKHEVDEGQPTPTRDIGVPGRSPSGVETCVVAHVVPQPRAIVGTVDFWAEETQAFHPLRQTVVAWGHERLVHGKPAQFEKPTAFCTARAVPLPVIVK